MASTLPTVSDCCSECSGISVTVTTTTSALNIFIYDTTALFRAGASPTTTTAFAVLNGDVTAYDGSGGFYTWISNSTATDDGVNIIKPSDRTVLEEGRWRKNV